MTEKAMAMEETTKGVAPIEVNGKEEKPVGDDVASSFAKPDLPLLAAAPECSLNREMLACPSH